MIALAGRHKPNRILVEDAGTGTALVAELRRHGVTIIGIRPEKDKVTRMSVQSAKFEAGLVHLPEQAPWLASFEVELFAFPGSRHDDQIDPVSQAPENGIGGVHFREPMTEHIVSTTTTQNTSSESRRFDETTVPVAEPGPPTQGDSIVRLCATDRSVLFSAAPRRLNLDLQGFRSGFLALPGVEYRGTW